MMFVIYIVCNWHTKWSYLARSPLPTTCSLQHALTITTVDGKKSRMYKTYEIIGKTIYQLVQDFFHQQNVCFLCCVSLSHRVAGSQPSNVSDPGNFVHINCTLQQTCQVYVGMHAFRFTLRVYCHVHACKIVLWQLTGWWFHSTHLKNII